MLSCDEAGVESDSEEDANGSKPGRSLAVQGRMATRKLARYIEVCVPWGLKLF